MSRLNSLIPKRALAVFPAFPALLALSAALLLGGCVNLAPGYERPAAPVPGRYPEPLAKGAEDTSAEGAAASDVGWRSFFADARLRGLIELALDHNRDLRVAVLNITQARV